MSSIEDSVGALLDDALLAKVASSNNQSRLQAHGQLVSILQVKDGWTHILVPSDSLPLHVFLSLFLSFFVFVIVSAFVSASVSVFVSVFLFVSVFVCPSICLSIYLSESVYIDGKSWLWPLLFVRLFLLWSVFV